MKILVIGDSFTSGNHYDDDGHTTSLHNYEQAWPKYFGDNFPDAEVENLSWHGRGNAVMFHVLMERLLKRGPDYYDLVLVAWGDCYRLSHANIISPDRHISINPFDYIKEKLDQNPDTLDYKFPDKLEPTKGWEQAYRNMSNVLMYFWTRNKNLKSFNETGQFKQTNLLLLTDHFNHVYTLESFLKQHNINYLFSQTTWPLYPYPATGLTMEEVDETIVEYFNTYGRHLKPDNWVNFPDNGNKDIMFSRLQDMGKLAQHEWMTEDDFNRGTGLHPTLEGHKIIADWWYEKYIEVYG